MHWGGFIHDFNVAESLTSKCHLILYTNVRGSFKFDVMRVVTKITLEYNLSLFLHHNIIPEQRLVVCNRICLIMLNASDVYAMSNS